MWHIIVNVLLNLYKFNIIMTKNMKNSISNYDIKYLIT